MARWEDVQLLQLGAGEIAVYNVQCGLMGEDVGFCEMVGITACTVTAVYAKYIIYMRLWCLCAQ